MNDIELREVLQVRLASIRSRMAQAARRAGRDPRTVTLVAVTKTVGLRVCRVLRDLGVQDFGENRPQELWRKSAALRDVRWHLIGHLQRNKVERTLPLVTLTHSVDSERLLAEIRKQGRPADVLLEINASGEASKGGFTPGEVLKLTPQLTESPQPRILGLMTMAAFAEDPEATRPTFRLLADLRRQLQAVLGQPLPELSMGMSNDFEVAIEEGATIIRLGTVLFQGLENVGD